MFREMRLKKQALTAAEAVAMLETCTAGVLAVTGDDGYPYAVPLSFAYEDGKIYFHSATKGHKIDAITRSDKVSFCVIAQDEVLPATFNTLYRSAIVFGRARLLTDDAEKRHALECLLRKYSPGYLTEGRAEIEREWARVSTVEIRIDHISGKAASELLAAQA